MSNGNWRSSSAQPDLVIKSEPYTMPAQGQDHVVEAADRDSDRRARWVRAVEMRPGSVAAARSRTTRSHI